MGVAKKVQFRGGTTTSHQSFTGAEREVTVDITKKTLVVHDGITPGGIPLAKELETQNSLDLKADKSTTYTKTELDNGQLDNRYYTETEIDNALDLKVNNIEIESVNLLRADKYLASQNVSNMIYSVDGKLSKVQYNNSTDVDYEVLTYNIDGKLTNVAHYVGSILKGNTVLSYISGKLSSAIFTAV